MTKKYTKAFNLDELCPVQKGFYLIPHSPAVIGRN